MTWVQPETIKCICDRNGQNPPMSMTIITVSLSDRPNERIGSCHRCYYCGRVENLKVSTAAAKKYGFNPQALRKLVNQSAMPTFTLQELRAGEITGAKIKDIQATEDILRPVEGYNPDAYIEPKQEALL